MQIFSELAGGFSADIQYLECVAGSHVLFVF